nr:unnamed protein product [Callosobruchus analis]
MQDSRGKRIVNLILKNSELNGTLHSTPVTPSTVEVNLVVQSENPTFGLGEEQAQAVEYPFQMSDLEEPFQSSGSEFVPDSTNASEESDISEDTPGLGNRVNVELVQETQYTGRKKRGRKRKHIDQSRADRKRLLQIQTRDTFHQEAKL